jgi:hypothetical protein
MGNSAWKVLVHQSCVHSTREPLFGDHLTIKADSASSGNKEKVNVFTGKFAKFPEHANGDTV